MHASDAIQGSVLSFVASVGQHEDVHRCHWHQFDVERRETVELLVVKSFVELHVVSIPSKYSHTLDIHTDGNVSLVHWSLLRIDQHLLPDRREETEDPRDSQDHSHLTVDQCVHLVLARFRH